MAQLQAARRGAEQNAARANSRCTERDCFASVTGTRVVETRCAPKCTITPEVDRRVNDLNPCLGLTVSVRPRKPIQRELLWRVLSHSARPIDKTNQPRNSLCVKRSTSCNICSWTILPSLSGWSKEVFLPCRRHNGVCGEQPHHFLHCRHSQSSGVGHAKIHTCCRVWFVKLVLSGTEKRYWRRAVKPRDAAGLKAPAIILT